EISECLVGSEMCIRDSAGTAHWALDEQDRPVWREDPRH
ncbi:hypothetical protein, partial [Pseudomonas aeruginosa]